MKLIEPSRHANLTCGNLKVSSDMFLHIGDSFKGIGGHPEHLHGRKMNFLMKTLLENFKIFQI